MRFDRRGLVATLAALPAAALFAPRIRSAQTLQVTPACGEGPEALTPLQTAGPYYKSASPERQNLRSEWGPVEAFDLQGQVLDTQCRPLSDVIVEIWHADDRGQYDNRGFLLRGQQRTDARGRWAFQTIRTNHYAQRTAHYHFRVQRPHERALVTQLYFPDHPRNPGDHIFDPRLLMKIERRDKVLTGQFDFVLPGRG